MLINTNPKAIVFVDYEHWYYSMLNNFHIRPNLRVWRNKLAQQYNITDVYFFADLSKDKISDELPRMREISNTIIETRNTNGFLKKDYTDFIMLDTIYQKAITSSVENFIIVTGDGHFSSVVSFLKNQCGKNVGIYGVRYSCSVQLKEFASWWVEMPDDTELLQEVCTAILENFRYIERQRVERGRVIRPTFWGTVDNVAAHCQIEKEHVKDGMSYLIAQGYVYQVEEKITFANSIKVLKVDWDRVGMDECFMAV